MKKKLSPSDLSDFMAQRLDAEKSETDAFVRRFFEEIEAGLISDKYVKIKGLGTFKLVAVGERESVNINTGERFQISGHTKVSFTPDNTLKDTVNRPFAHFETVDLSDDMDLSEFEEIDKLSTAELEGYEEEEDADEEDAGEEEAVDEPAEESRVNSSEKEEAKEEKESEPQASATLEQSKPSMDGSNATPTPPIPLPESSTEEQREKTTEPTPDNRKEEGKAPSSATTDIIPISSGNEHVSTPANGVKAPTATTPASRSNQPSQSDAQEERSEASEPSNGTSPAPIQETDMQEAQTTNGMDAEMDDIEVSAPHPINQAGSMPPTMNGSLGYTYQEVPSRRKRNGWNIATLTLCGLLLMVGCYFVGYFRMLCPNCFFDEEEPAPTQRPQQADPSQTMPISPTKQEQHSQTPAAATQATHPVQSDTSARPAPQAAPMSQSNSAENATLAAQPTVNGNAKTKKAETVYHKVKKGENLTRIVRRHYGTEAYVGRIIQINHLKNANNVKEGMVIELPPLK